MSSKSTRKLALLFCSLIGVLAVAFIFRVELLRAGANRILDDNAIVLLELQALEPGFHGVTAEGVDLLFEASGLRLTLAAVDLRWHRTGFFSLPVVDALSVGSARVTQQGGAAQPDTGDSTVQLGDVLQLLREFPLADIAVDEITIPQWPNAIGLALQRQPDGLALQVASAALQLELAFTQAEAGAPAQLQAALTHETSAIGDLLLQLEPLASDWQLRGNGRLNVTAAAGLPALTGAQALALPVSAGLLNWDIAAVIAGDRLDALPDALTLGIDGGSFVRIPAGLIPGMSRIDIALDAPAQATLLLDDGIVISEATLPLTASGTYQTQPFTFAATLAPTDCRLSAGLACTANFEADATLANYTVADAGNDAAAGPALAIADLAFGGEGVLAIDDGGVQVTLGDGARVSNGRLVAPSFTIAGMYLVTATDAPLVVLLPDDGPMTVNAGRITGTLGQTDVAGYQVSSDFVVGDIDVTLAAVPSGQFALQTQGLTVSSQAWLPAVDIDARIEFDQDNLRFSSPVLLRDAPADPGLQVKGSYSLASGAAAIALELPRLTLDGEGKSLSSYFIGWPWPFDLMTGNLAATIALQLQPFESGGDDQDAARDDGTARITGTVEATMTDIAGYYNELFFGGVDTMFTAELDSAALLPVNTPPLALAIDEINVGLPISDIAVSFEVNGDANTMTVHSFYGETLGGTLTGEDFVYEPGSDGNTMRVHFDGLRLDRVLELAEYDGIEASGAVSGELPIRLSPDGIEVAEGRLQADAPGGSIHYQSATGAGGNPAMDLVNQALSNYQFESLESSIDYRPDGELILSMQLQGHNPDMNDGQRINLNLNLSDNIPVLLQSLQAGRAIEEFVQKQYQRDEE